MGPKWGSSDQTGCRPGGKLGCGSGNDWMGYFLVVCLPIAVFVVCCSLCKNSRFAKLLRNSCATAAGAGEETRVDQKAWVCPMSLLNHAYVTGAFGNQLKPQPVVQGSHLVSR